MFPKSGWLLFIILLTLALTGWGLVNVISYFQISNRVAIIGDGLKLKAPADKIIQYTEYDKTGNIIQYTYISNKEVLPSTYEGIKEDISKRTPNSQAFLKSSKPLNDKEVEETYVGKFYTKPRFYQEGNTWYELQSATTTKTAFFLQTRPTLLTKAKQFLGQPVFADTFYAGTGDGNITHGNALSTSWATAHDATTGTSVDQPTSSNSYEGVTYLSGYAIFRVFLPFNTSSIPSSATIQSGSLGVYVTAKDSDTSSDGYGYFQVVETSQPSSSALTTADYDLCGDAISNPTTGSNTINYSSITTGDYSIFTLDSTGLSWVAANGVASSCGGGTGVTCLGIREGHDIQNVAGTTFTKRIRINTSETTGTSQDPYLTVTYSVTAPALKINGGTVNINGGTVNVR